MMIIKLNVQQNNQLVKHMSTSLCAKGLRRILQIITPKQNSNVIFNNPVLSMDKNFQVILFVQNTPPIVPVIHVCYSSVYNEDISKALDDIESMWICKLLTSVPPEESPYIFGTEEFFQDIYGINSIIVNPNDSIDTFAKSHLDNINIITTPHVPRGSVIYIPIPEKLGVIYVHSDWKYLEQLDTWESQLAFALDSKSFIYKKGRND